MHFVLSSLDGQFRFEGAKRDARGFFFATIDASRRRLYKRPHERVPLLCEVTEGRGNGAGHLLVVFLRPLFDPTFLRRGAQGKGIRPGESGDHRKTQSRVVHVQADLQSAVLRRFPRQAGMNFSRRGFLALLVATIPPFAVFAQTAPPDSFPDRAKAFGGVPFGASLEEAKKFWQLEAVDGASVPGDPVALYLREEESLVLGGLVAREVIYYFLNGKFYAVSFSTPDSRQTTIIREALDAGYGTAPQEDAKGRSLVWPGQSVTAQLLLETSTGEGRVLFFSNELQPEYERCLREAAAKTALQLGTKPGG